MGRIGVIIRLSQYCWEVGTAGCGTVMWTLEMDR
jgi:hypothetical protein